VDIIDLKKNRAFAVIDPNCAVNQIYIFYSKQPNITAHVCRLGNKLWLITSDRQA